ncbi:hypothetical protein GF389_04650 [Candidatus Dojkabacteria bacterium]|nr:hypothetical protein [Candidatus Dojkabacteria bacterium]
MLILTSSGQFIARNEEKVNKYLPKPLNDCKIAYITTAANRVDDRTYLETHEEKMDELGWDYTEIDIAGKTEEELTRIFSEYDIVLVEGGNTFYLLKAIRESGFEKVIKELIDQGLVYIGSSAGSYVACPSIIMAKWTNANEKFDECGITDYTAMNLVPFLILAHMNDEREKLLTEKKKETDLPVKALTDNQAVVVRDGNTQLLNDSS